MGRIPDYLRGQYVASVILRILAAGMLLWAMERNVAGYYVALRWVVCAASLFTLYFASEFKMVGVMWVFGLTAFLFNPIIPMHLARRTWSGIDLLVAVLMIWSIYRIRANNPSRAPQNDMRGGE